MLALHRLALPLAVTVAALAFTGCSFNQGGTTAKQAASAIASVTSSTATPGGAVTTIPAEPASPALATTKAPVLRGDYDIEKHADLTSREEYEPLVSRVVSCEEGYVTIDTVATALQIDSNCGYVEVTGVGNAIVAEDISTLEVNGVNLTIFARSVDKVSATGTGNRVFWTGITPTIIDTGVNNQFLPAP